ncbi:conserved hypothetical protein [Tenacibaculum maritimum]|uniref:ATP-binding protein n=1 Tax=Tenacibaculum maritimum TaxID=107401 RepID=UPI0012E4064B|nr:ATP-binding protein [Tenacibaculum maritimum]CAA0231066.1 conserved hypothetical protein [Tenacibaculum maritimum]
MQLLELKIEKYKNLDNFHWEIGEENATSALLLLGKNASGKTNVLEALLKIFDFLIHSKKEKASFSFSITYKIEVVTLTISCIQNQELEGVTISDKFIPVSEIRRNNDTWRVPHKTELDNILPENIILYYSGFSGRFLEITNEFKKEYSTKFRKQKAVSLPPFISLEPSHYKMILLALFSFSPENSIYEDFFEKYFNIKEIHSVEIKITKHTGWVKDHSYENFFDTTGIVRNFIERLHIIYIDENDSNPEYIYSTQNPERVNAVKYVFKGNTFLLKLKEIFGYENDIFSLFNILTTTKNLGWLDIKLKKSNIEDSIPFKYLSEGEQQFLAIKGMIYLLQGRNSLFLWDEPDTYLNPYWQWDLIPSLENDKSDIGAIQRDQFILTTHSPVLLSTVKNMAYSISEGVITPIQSTYGLTIDETLLKQNINIRVKEVETSLKTYLDLISQGEGESDAAKILKSELESKLGEAHPEMQRANVIKSFYE